MPIGVKVGLQVGINSGVAVGINADASGGGTPPVSLVGRKGLAVTGQSNDNGEHYGRFLTLDDYTSPYANVYQFDQLALAANDPIIWLDGIRGPVQLSRRTATGTFSLGDFGPEQALMRYLDWSEPGQWVVIKFAVGGTNAPKWKPAASGGTYPTIPPKLADLAISTIQGLLTTYGITLACIVDTQGTSDVTVHADAIAFQVNKQPYYSALIAAFPGKPIVISQTITTFTPGADNTAVRTAQAALATANSPTTTLVNEEGIFTNNTTAHHFADGLKVWGDRLAVEVITRASVVEKPKANFRQRLHPTVALRVDFVDTTRCATSANASYLWNFGDAATDTIANPSHTYASPGTYTVTLVWTAANGKSDTFIDTVVVVAVTWPIDATALRAGPSTAADFTAFLSTAQVTSGPPTSSWTLQQGAGNCIDQIGGNTLGNFNITLLAQAVTGYTRLGFTNMDGNANHNMTNTTTVPDASTTPMALMFRAQFPAGLPAAVREIAGVGAGTTCKIQLGNDDGKLRVNGTGVTQRTQFSVLGTTQLIVIQVEPSVSGFTAGRIRVFTETEIFVQDLTVTAGIALWLAGLTASASATFYLQAWLYTAAAAQKTIAEWRRIYTLDGAVVPW